MEANGKPHPGIRIDRIEVGGEAVGFIFAASTVYTFFVGLPALRWFLLGAIVIGSLTSVALGIFHRRKPTRLLTLNPH